MMYYMPLFVEIPFYVTFSQPAQKRGGIADLAAIAAHCDDLIPAVGIKTLKGPNRWSLYDGSVTLGLREGGSEGNSLDRAAIDRCV